MKNRTALFLAVATLVGSACQDTAGIDGNASLADRTEILGALDESGFAGEDFGAAEPESSFAAAPGGAEAAAAVLTGGTVTLPALWGIRHGTPTARSRTINVSNDTATVSVSLEFNSQFSMIVPQSGAAPQTVTKTAATVMSQKATLVRNDSVSMTDTLRRHKWKIVQVSPQNWQLKDVGKQTTRITRVRVLVNGVLKIEVTDPSQVYDIDNRMPRLHRGEVVQVLADVANTANTGNTPATFVFLNVMHADPGGLGWRRLLMQDLGGGSFQLSWMVRLAGRDRLVVNALDSQTFQADAGTDARGNAWAIPYRIE